MQFTLSSICSSQVYKYWNNYMLCVHSVSVHHNEFNIKPLIKTFCFTGFKWGLVYNG